MGLSNVPWEWDKPMCLGMGLANALCEWDYPMCPGNGTIQCVLERKGTSQCALGMGLANVPWE